MVSSATLTVNLNKFRALSRPDRDLLLESVLSLPLIHLGLLLLGYARLCRTMEWLAQHRPSDVSRSTSDALSRARGIARIVGIAARHSPYRATCLRRSLLLWWFLRREGIHSMIRFGVRKWNGGLAAHAWVEYEGTIANDSAEVCAQYAALNDPFPPTSLGL